MDITLKHQVLNLLKQDEKIEAIKLVHHSTDWGLKESKDYVDSLHYGETIQIPKSNYVEKELLSKVLRLLAKGRKIPAIKLVTEQTTMGLKEAKDYVESLR